MRLPISGLGVRFRLPDGRDDFAILEAHGGAIGRGTGGGEAQAATLERALDALSRLAELASGTSASAGAAASISPAPDAGCWAQLTITDFEAALLGLRSFLFGDAVRSIVRCTCTERMEIEFSITHLLDEAQPRIPRRIKPSASRPEWFELHPTREFHDQTGRDTDNETAFRLPTVSDQILALRSPNPYGFLKRHCIAMGASAGRMSLSIERAMEAMSPSISRPIEGVCAACGTVLTAQLHVPSLVLHELRAAAAHVYRDVHTIAAAYHWDESAILAIPQLRRQAYSDAIRQAGAR